MTVEISKATTPAEIDEFIGLPNKLYQGLPGFVPQLMMERRSILDPRKGSFFKRGLVQYWLAKRDGRTVGRISAQIDPLLPEGGALHGAGFFGCLDTIDDEEVTGALLQTTEAWLVEQGKMRTTGPMLLAMSGEPGLLVEGQEEPPLITAAWHPTYLARHLEKHGYKGIKDLHYWRFTNTAEKVGALKKRKRLRSLPEGITVRQVNMKDFADEAEILRQMFNDGWVDNWGYVPFQPEEMASIATEMKPLIKPNYGIIMQDGDEIAAVAMIIPNLFEITSDLGPELGPLGWIRFLWRMKTHKFRTGYVIMLGISRRYHKSIGGAVIAMTLVDEFIDRMLPYSDKGDWLEGGWVLDDNTPLRKILERYGLEIKRVMRLYGKELAGA
jgi:hypothetical protein